MDDQNTTYSLNDYYKLPDGRYISYYELANNPKYSTRQEDTGMKQIFQKISQIWNYYIKKEEN